MDGAPAALAVLDTFDQQASVVAFEYVSMLMGLGMLACLPLVPLLRQTRHGTVRPPAPE